MPTLVDGYNLVYAAGILSRNVGPGTLQRAREALIGFLKASLSETERTDTTVVFDAKSAPPDLPDEQICDGLRVLYALNYPTADALIVELIRADSAPRRLVVVSSDRQIQRAAKRRRATAVDSDQWYGDLRRRRREAARRELAPAEKPAAPVAETEVEYWLDFFQDGMPAEISPHPPESTPADHGASVDIRDARESLDADIANPFPPGYGEDLLIDEED